MFNITPWEGMKHDHPFFFNCNVFKFNELFPFKFTQKKNPFIFLKYLTYLSRQPIHSAINTC